MNANSVMWDSNYSMWTTKDLEDVQNFIKQYTHYKFGSSVIVTSEKIFHLLVSLTKTMRPKTGDIMTRCFLDDEIPDQYYSKENLKMEAIQIAIAQIENDLEETSCDYCSIWNSKYQSDLNWYPKPKISSRKNTEVLSMRF
jgi:hypothetical protein